MLNPAPVCLRGGYLLTRFRSVFAVFVLLLGFTQAAFSQATCADLFSRKVRTESTIKELSLLAFNVENLLAGKNGQPMAGHEAKFKELREVIGEASPDIAILPEIASPTALDVLAMGTLAGRFRPLMAEGKWLGAEVGFLVRSDLPWDVRTVSNRHLEWKNRVTSVVQPLFPHDLPVLEVRRSAADRDPLFVVIGNHAKAKRDSPGDPESLAWRTAEYEEAARIIDSYLQRRVSVFFGGDLNADARRDPELRPLKLKMASALAVAPDAVPEHERVTHTFHPEGAASEKTQLDDIFVSPELVRSIKSARILRYRDRAGRVRPIAETFEQRKLQPSDHLPVKITVSTEELFREAN